MNTRFGLLATGLIAAILTAVGPAAFRGEMPLAAPSGDRDATASAPEGKLQEADQALQNAEGGVRFVSLGNSVPLAKARRALWQAMEDYSSGHRALSRTSNPSGQFSA